MKKLAIPLALALLATPAFARDATPGSATSGSAGSAAIGGQSATTAGVGAVSNGTAGDSQAMAMGGSAAGDNARTHAGVHGNTNLNGNAMAMANDQGTMARSHTICHDRSDSTSCSTKTMEHEPGSKPEKSTSTGSGAIQ